MNGWYSASQENVFLIVGLGRRKRILFANPPRLVI